MFEHTVKWRPAFDRRNPNPANDYGIGAVLIEFVARGELGAVVLQVHTNWHLPPDNKRLSRIFPEPGPFLLTTHALRPEHGDAGQSGPCEYLDNQTCYPDVNYWAGAPIFERLLREGDAGVWAALEDWYRDVFEATK